MLQAHPTRSSDACKTYQSDPGLGSSLTLYTQGERPFVSRPFWSEKIITAVIQSSPRRPARDVKAGYSQPTAYGGDISSQTKQHKHHSPHGGCQPVPQHATDGPCTLTTSCEALCNPPRAARASAPSGRAHGPLAAMHSVHTPSATSKPVQHQPPRLRLYSQREGDGRWCSTVRVSNTRGESVGDRAASGIRAA